MHFVIVYIPHWLIRYITLKVSPPLRYFVYIPHWLIRYTLSEYPVEFVDPSLYSSLVDSILSVVVVLYIGIRAGLYSSLVDSIPEDRRLMRRRNWSLYSSLVDSIQCYSA